MIQAGIKDKRGCSNPVFLEFKAPIDPQDPKGIIKYNPDSFPSDQELHVSGDSQQFALK